MSANQNGDYYHVLGVDDHASLQEIREAYRKLAFQYHPDRNQGNPEATEKMKAINEAYAMLSSPAKRSEYDSLRSRYGASAYAQYRQTHTQEDIFRGSDIDQIFEEFARSFGFRSSGEIFREFYGPGFKTTEFRGPGFVFRSYTYSRGQTGETGKEPTADTTNSASDGEVSRRIPETLFGAQAPTPGRDVYGVLRITPEVAVSGGEVRYELRVSGNHRNLMVKVPAGMRAGLTIRLKGIGEPGAGGAGPGDVLLRVKIRTGLLQRLKALLGRH